MTVLALTSAKGSPGVTTLAARLADVVARHELRSCGERPVVVVEADPAGGDLAARRGLAGTPGLASLALSARRSLGPDVVLAHCQQLGPVQVLAGVAGCRQGSVVLPVVPRLVEALRAIGAFVVLDLGRLGPPPAAGEPSVLAGADFVALVTRTGTECVVHARSAVDNLRTLGVAPELVLVGRPEYPRHAIETAVGAPVLAVVAHAPAEAAAAPAGVVRGRRGELARSVDELARVLTVRLAVSAAADPADPAEPPGPAHTGPGDGSQPCPADGGESSVLPFRTRTAGGASPAAPA